MTETIEEYIDEQGRRCRRRTITEMKWSMAKGILVPDERAVDANGRPMIQIDPAQFKGTHGKPFGKVMAWDGTGDIPHMPLFDAYVGIIGMKNRRGILPGGFEMLENIEINDRTIALVTKLTEKAMNKLLRRGIDGLVAKAATRHKELKALTRLLAVASEMGLELNPMATKMVEEAVEDQLGRALWPIANGAGIEGQQLYVVLDAGVEEGTCVTGDFSVGKTLATWRFPCVLEQGLMLVRNVRPQPHHCYHGEVTPHVIFLNPRDTMDRQQSDDDGDIIGATDNPDVVELFTYAEDKDGVFLIEPDGMKYDLPMYNEVEQRYCEVTCKWIDC